MTATQNISALPAAAAIAPGDLAPLSQGSSGTNTGTTRSATLAQIIETPFAATGGVPLRSAAARAYDLPNFADSGAVGNGIADDTAALNAWLAGIAATKGVSLVVMDQRQYLIDSANLTIPMGISIVGPWLGGRGDNATTEDYSAVPASFILNPTYTIAASLASAISGCCIRRKGLVAATTVVGLVANQLGKAGTAITVSSVTADAASNVLIERNLILGFNQAIYVYNNSRMKIKDNDFDCTNGILVQASYDWDEISGNEGWPFLSVQNPLTQGSATIVAITSSSIVGGLRRFITAAPHGFSTGWPILITTEHTGSGVSPCYGVSPITVIDSVTFDLNTASGLTTAATGSPSGPGSGAGAGGYAIVAVVINYGIAYKCLAGMDWGMWHNNDSWGFAIGHRTDSCDNVTCVNCGADNYYTYGYWYSIGFQALNSASTPTWIGCQAAAQQTGWSMSTGTGGQAKSGLMVGCSTWGINGAVIDLQAGDLEVVGCKFNDTFSTGCFFNIGASGGTLELVGVKGALPIVNYSSNTVMITGGDYGVANQHGATISAAGSTQGTATAITTQIAEVNVVSSGQGVILPLTAQIWSTIKVINAAATSLLVYPPTGGQIGTGSVNAGATLGGTTAANYTRVSATVWQIG